eukprot:XP_001695813.1 predicted protein [Chlamydomonas reinhardtii]
MLWARVRVMDRRNWQQLGAAMSGRRSAQREWRLTGWRAPQQLTAGALQLGATAQAAPAPVARSTGPPPSIASSWTPAANPAPQHSRRPGTAAGSTSQGPLARQALVVSRQRLAPSRNIPPSAPPAERAGPHGHARSAPAPACTPNKQRQPTRPDAWR